MTLEDVLPEPADLMVAAGVIFGLVFGPVVAGVGLIEGRPVVESVGLGLATVVAPVAVAAWAGFVLYVTEQYLI